MSTLKRRLVGVIIFLIAAFFGVNITGSMFGKIGGLVSFFVISVSFFFMWLAIGIWKGISKVRKNDYDTDSPPPSVNL